MATVDLSSRETRIIGTRSGPVQEAGKFKCIPESRRLREALREKCRVFVPSLDPQRPIGRRGLEAVAKAVLRELGLSDQFVGWTMVTLASLFWRNWVAAVPVHRRLLLLPRPESCETEAYPTDGEIGGGRDLGFRQLADFARAQGYVIVTADHQTNLSDLILEQEFDAVMGAADLDTLEKAIDKIAALGIPCMAVPLPSNHQDQHLLDADWIREMVELPHVQSPVHLASYAHRMRAIRKLFDPQQLTRLVPWSKAGFDLDSSPSNPARTVDPILATEMIAHEFLARGGKYSRPFITLVVYDALSAPQNPKMIALNAPQRLPDSVQRAAVAIEAFHKASLVHDDIEDNDDYRYGAPALHREIGIPAAINVGDYLIGLGYRLVSYRTEASADHITVQVLAVLAEAHHELAQGQGAELFWRDARNKRLTPQDALTIYRLKTSPAFEAALRVGATLAGESERYREPFRQFAHCLGVGFQILNDLKDWDEDATNKVAAGGDVLGGRPTLLLALALEAMNEADQRQLLAYVAGDDHPQPVRLGRVRDLYLKSDVFRRAQEIIENHRRQAEAVAAAIRPAELQRLMYHLTETVLSYP